MSPQELLNWSDDELKRFALSSDAPHLKQIFDQISEEIRGAKLYSGQPRTSGSEESLSLARLGLRLAEHSGNEQLLVESWRMLAYSLNANEQYEEAIPYYKKLIDKYEEFGAKEQAARNRIGYVSALAHAGRRQEALDVASVAERWFAEIYDDHARARLYTNLGILYHRLDEHAKGADYYVMAAEIFEKLGDKRALAQTYLNLANVLSMIDQFEGSDNLYERAEKLSDELELFELSAQASYNRAYLHYLRGRYSDALHSFARLRQRFERSGSRRHHALCDLDEAEIYLQLSLSKDASILAERAAGQFKELGHAYEEAKATSLYGVAMMQMHRYAEALGAFRIAQTIFEAEGNQYRIGLLDLYRAEVHFSLQRFWEAQSLGTQAKANFERMGIPSKRIFSLVLLGRVHLALNDLMAAEACSKKMFDLIRETKIPLLLFPCHVLSAEIADRMRQWDEAQRHYELAAEDLERHHARLDHDDLRVTFFKGRHQVYDALVRLSLDRLDPEHGLPAAYSWCERSRSRGLIELLSHYAPSGRGQVEQSLLSKINRLREELNISYARSKPEAQPVTTAANFDSIAFKEHELARTLREVSGVDPEYASLQQVSIATIDSVRAVLPEKTTLIEYFTAGEEILAFIIAQNGTRVVRRLCPLSRVVGLQERLGFQLEKFMLGREYVSDHAGQILESAKRHLHELYRHLMAPFLEDIDAPHLAIVPHGTLHFLPFHAFWDGQNYLIDNYEVSYAPSASVLKYCLEKPRIAGKSPLLVGVADERAPLVGQEIANLTRLFPDARVLLNEDATREAFMESCQWSSFVHIATHATFRQDNPMFSSFKLADGWLTAFDLFSMTCQTNLVTLSGCKSGMSEVTGSDDLLGLMRGFLYAGARSLLLSLWNVSDESTADLMVRFYDEWRQGSEKSAALRTAMLAVRAENPNPFYWAPFLLVGNP